MGAFSVEFIAIVGACILSFREFRACGAPTFSGEKDPIGNRRWLADMANAFRTSFCPEETKVSYASFLLKDGAHG